MRVCRGCSTPIERLRPHAVWCSDACRVRDYRIRNGWTPKERGPRAPERAKALTTAKRRHPFRGPCVECGSKIPEGRRLDARYCSERCLGAVVRRSTGSPGRPSNLRIRGGVRLEVFERDSWICQLCGDPVDREASYPDPESPVVDHWIPIALGGDHDPANFVTAHRLCNDMKKAKHPDELGLVRMKEVSK
jgi:predicted nucleic acid-binding Zn ribbon protein